MIDAAEDKAFLAQATLLLVEDDPDARAHLAKALRRRAGRVLTASGGAEGLKAYRAERPDLVVTDIQMPGSLDGVMLARVVHERWPPIRIILVSGKLMRSDIDIPPDSRFFAKPLAADDMVAEMQDMIGHHACGGQN